MAKKIGQYAVHLRDDKGELHSFLPGDEVPAWAAKLMGDHCFAGHTAKGTDDDGDDDTGDDGDDDDGDETAVPGSRAKLAEWSAYAEANDVDTDGLTKAQIVAACEEAGVPVE